jgi:3'(2'), 5'-bisphosphate nucleotidase
MDWLLLEKDASPPMLVSCVRAALNAGQAILDCRRVGAGVRLKPDQSPVTQADEQAEAIILQQLHRDYPHIPVIAEEAVSAGCIPAQIGPEFFLVDALDGTREFVNGHDDFTVNIALIRDGQPVAGIVYAPVLRVAWTAFDGHAEKWMFREDFSLLSRHDLGCRLAMERQRALVSRSHNSPATQDYLQDHAISDIDIVGSSLKFCVLAEGLADVYPRLSRTMEWDTAAGDAILRMAGGMTRDLQGQPLAYGKINQRDDSDFANPHFIARGRS